MELFDIVDENGNVIGQATRQECHGNPALLHRTVHVLVFKDKQLWLQKRSMTKDIQPGKWDTSVGGHMMSGESVAQAAVREMKEEMGISVQASQLWFCYRYIMRNEIESELVHTFMYLLPDNARIVIQQEEIDEGRFWSANQIEQQLGYDMFTPNFEDEWHRFKQSYLASRFIL